MKNIVLYALVITLVMFGDLLCRLVGIDFGRKAALARSRWLNACIPVRFDADESFLASTVQPWPEAWSTANSLAMARTVSDDIFKLFVAEKKGRGTHYRRGFSTVYGIVEKYRGQIQARNHESGSYEFSRLFLLGLLAAEHLSF